MQRYTLKPTEENLLSSIEEDKYYRSQDIKNFIEALDLIEGNAFISLNAGWGEGKTFYVKQIEKTLEHLTNKIFKQTDEKLDASFRKNQILSSIEIKNSYLPIYYDAWMYDNHDDPLMSLVLIMVKQCKKYLDTKINPEKLSNKVLSLFDLLELSVGNITVSSNLKNVKEILSGRDILSSVKTAEEIRECVKSIFNDVIVEEAQKLVIFIDELDRCRPSFAIEMLERIKHYFDDERVIIVMSINKTQLIHTISNHYGDKFDSMGYLNKFFDLNIHLPKVDIPHIAKHGEEQFVMSNMADELIDYYALTLRDALIYKQYIETLPVNYINDFSAQGCFLSVFVPVILVLDIVSEEEKMKFLNGESDILENLFYLENSLYRAAYKLGSGLISEKYERCNDGFEKIKEAYEYIFGNRSELKKIDGSELERNLKNRCLQLCSGFIN